MMHLLIILNKVLVKTFYKDNAGFFLILTGLCFGFLRMTEHIALAQLFVSSMYILLIPISLWVLYTLKVMLYNREAVSLNQNTFLSSFIFIPFGAKTILLLATATAQLSPILAYGFFLIKIASDINQTVSIYFISVALCSLVGVVVFSSNRNLLYQTQHHQITFIKRAFDSHFTKPQVQFFIEWAMRARPAIFFGAKLFAMAVIIGISRLYLFDDYDERLMALGVMLASAANIGLAFQFHRFENYHFQWMKNLPFTHSQRIFLFVITFMLICMPEWIVLLRFFPAQLTLWHYIEFFCFSISLLFLSYTSLFMNHIVFEKLTQYMFFSFLALMLLILFKVPLLLLTGIQILVAVYILRKHYYTFEFTAGKE